MPVQPNHIKIDTTFQWKILQAIAEVDRTRRSARVVDGAIQTYKRVELRAREWSTSAGPLSSWLSSRLTNQRLQAVIKDDIDFIIRPFDRIPAAVTFEASPPRAVPTENYYFISFAAHSQSEERISFPRPAWPDKTDRRRNRRVIELKYLLRIGFLWLIGSTSGQRNGHRFHFQPSFSHGIDNNSWPSVSSPISGCLSIWVNNRVSDGIYFSRYRMGEVT